MDELLVDEWIVVASLSMVNYPPLNSRSKISPSHNYFSILLHNDRRSDREQFYM